MCRDPMIRVTRIPGGSRNKIHRHVYSAQTIDKISWAGQTSQTSASRLTNRQVPIIDGAKGRLALSVSNVSGVRSPVERIMTTHRPDAGSSSGRRHHPRPSSALRNIGRNTARQFHLARHLPAGFCHRTGARRLQDPIVPPQHRRDRNGHAVREFGRNKRIPQPPRFQISHCHLPMAKDPAARLLRSRSRKQNPGTQFALQRVPGKQIDNIYTFVK